MHSGAEGCGCVGGGGGEEGTAKSDGETRRLDKNVVFSTVKIKYFTVVYSITQFNVSTSSPPKER